ncbi:hypothetical protein GH714_003838 [Hevea brasiliensis]|uniref:Uncharacterized protein n=1 Tax=Hevea brasiliensis TaxID=3981 RepID=A0A6A6L1T9_HEVBR|nr:hypothetical protein GH714_003838 [Hevea brasiliensis]
MNFQLAVQLISLPTMLQENTFRKQQKRRLDAEKLLTMKVKGFLSLFLIILMVSAVHSEEDLVLFTGVVFWQSKDWITLNEPLTVVVDGYATGIKAPGRCSEWLPVNCTGGDSSTEPYIAAHNQLLAHAAAVKVYRDKYQISYRDFNVTRNLLMIFEGLNYYTAKYAADVPCQSENLSYPTDFCALCAPDRNGIPIGPKSGSDWLYIDIDTDRVELEDNSRVDYFNDHLSFIQKAIMKGVKVKDTLDGHF